MYEPGECWQANMSIKGNATRSALCASVHQETIVLLLLESNRGEGERKDEPANVATLALSIYWMDERTSSFIDQTTGPLSTFTYCLLLQHWMVE